MKNVIIVGMARSGTSLATALFAHSGYFIAEHPEEDLRPGDEHNPFGYWEAEPLVERNAQLLAEAGFPHHNTWWYAGVDQALAEAVGNLEPSAADRELAARYERNSPWAWKDPRFCITLPYWWKAINRENAAVLHMRRSPDAIYHSFRRIGWVGGGREAKDEILRRIAVHVEAAEAAILRLDIPHLVVQYEELVAQPKATCARIEKFFGLQIAHPELVQPQLNHNALARRVPAMLRRALPSSVRRVIKAIVPRALLARLLPERGFLDKAAGRDSTPRPPAC